jgi:hypothetical protein
MARRFFFCASVAAVVRGHSARLRGFGARRTTPEYFSSDLNKHVRTKLRRLAGAVVFDV